MMSTFLRRFCAAREGVAVIELALIAPAILVMTLLSFEVWQASARIEDMRGGLKAGAQYYMNGGSDDAAARALALSSWPKRASDAQVSATRSCACGAAAQVCTSLCASGDPPAALITLRATATYPDAFFNKSLAEQRIVRVR